MKLNQNDIHHTSTITRVNNINNLSCLIISGLPENNKEFIELYNNSFMLWKSTWENLIFPNGFVSDPFFNSDHIIVLHQDDDVAAVAILNSYDLNYPVYNHNLYLKDFLHLNIIGEEQSFTTIEYICAAKPWRQKNLTIAKILIGLSKKIHLQEGTDFLFGTARVDLGIETLGADFGFQNYGQVERYGLSCALMVKARMSNPTHPDQDIVTIIDKLWDQRNSNSINLNIQKISA